MTLNSLSHMPSITTHHNTSFSSVNGCQTPVDRSPMTPRPRSRSNSILRAMSHATALPSPASLSTPNSPTAGPRRAATYSSENFLSRIPSFVHAFDNTSSSSSTVETPWINSTDDVELQKPIGYGSSAVVYAAIYKPSNAQVAVKLIDLDMFERNQIDELRRETALMALSRHPNVLRVYGSFLHGSKLHIVTPYLSGGSCLDIMKTGFPDGFDEISIATILKQALEGLIYLHKNGHIHRDIKAGNLLMDDQGTVLLADFGVSSSLTENNELRKTFVGTPCWMAPEVMEQAGYDYKADIWSFGITALELATGHAPFAKYPPMKVLMMTLSKDPPTLDREHTKHRYSKTFKDMIDSCLQKDPKNRPTAEKLVQHPFFKQAKKKDCLVKSVLSQVPPLDQRPRKKVPQRHISFESNENWDFDIGSDHSDQEPDASKPTSSTCVRLASPPPIKRHISFGDIVIKNPVRPSPKDTPRPSPRPSPQVSPRASPAPSPTNEGPPSLGSSSPSSSPTRELPERALDNESGLARSPPLHPVMPTPSIMRRSRFVIEENVAPDHHGTVQSIDSNMSSYFPSSNATHTTDPVTEASQETEVKKGRFSVNHPVTRCADEGHAATLEHRSISLSRVNSNESSCDRRSRFAIQRLVSPPSSAEHTVKSETAPCKVSRFSVEKDEGNKEPAPAPLETPVVLPECWKKGRFELTGGSTVLTDVKHDFKEGYHHDSPQSSTTNTSPTSSIERGSGYRLQDHMVPSLVVSHMETLLRQTELHKALLTEVLTNMATTCGHPPPATALHRGRCASNETRGSPDMWGLDDLQQQRSRSRSLPSEISATVIRLQHLLSLSEQEKDRLVRENETLKREVEVLRQKQGLHSNKERMTEGTQTQDTVSSASLPVHEVALDATHESTDTKPQQ